MRTGIIRKVILVFLVSLPLGASEVIFLGDEEKGGDLSVNLTYDEKDLTRREQVELPDEITREFHLLKHLEMLETLLFIQELQRVAGNNTIDHRLTFNLLEREMRNINKDYEEARYQLMGELRKGELK